MSLYRLLVAAMLLLIGSLTAANLWLYLQGSQQFLNHQLASHAQDTATSLGLSLSPVLAQGDWVLAGSMVDSIFDRGDYREIQLTSLDGTEKILRRRQEIDTGTPTWFQALLPLEAATESSEVNAQWRLVAELSIQASTERAHQYLWRISLRALWSAGLLALVAGLTGSWILRRLLKPLHLAEKQAAGLRRHRYLKQAHLPRFRELRSLVQTMNLMVDNSEAMFHEQCRQVERLRAQSLVDEQTGLGNLSRGRQRLAQLLSDEELGGGMLVRLHLVGLDRVELKGGVDGEQALLREIAAILTETTVRLPYSRAYRIGFADFLLLFPGIMQDTLAQLEAEMRQHLLSALQQAGGERVLLVSVPYQLGDVGERLEERLEAVMSKALLHEESSLYLCEQEGEPGWVEPSEQARHLDKVLNQPPRLLWQASEGAGGEYLYHEVLVRFGEGDNVAGPGAVMAQVARQQCHQRFDLLILDTLLVQLPRLPKRSVLTCNLTAESVLDPLFIKPLCHRLATHWNRVGLEIPERAFLMDPDRTRAVIETLANKGARLWLDHTTPSGMVLLAQPGLTGIKLDPAYTRALLEEPGQNDLIEMMVRAAHGRGLKVVAQQVEQAELAARLWSLGIDAVQGYGVSPPEPLGADAKRGPDDNGVQSPL
ncbi:bifunctional diguanylate cyclase/phosphodiesterase [Ferrimonas gelatinilytica]|uniref:EAL domain-containing protein n=1 Tax=Ferrimonas gelatinilytica TaxID=1255257 RepID=A0ABP9SDU3_9GAMM